MYMGRELDHKDDVIEKVVCRASCIVERRACCRCAMIKRCQEILILQICGHILRSHNILGEYIGHVYDITLSEVLSEQIYNMYSITRLYIPDNAA